MKSKRSSTTRSEAFHILHPSVSVKSSPAIKAQILLLVWGSNKPSLCPLNILNIITVQHSIYTDYRRYVANTEYILSSDLKSPRWIEHFRQFHFEFPGTTHFAKLCCKRPLGKILVFSEKYCVKSKTYTNLMKEIQLPQIWL